MNDRKAYNSTLRPISKKRLKEMTSGLKAEVKKKGGGTKIVATTRKALHFIEGHPLYNKVIFRASNLPPKRDDLARRADALFSEVVRRRATKERPVNAAVSDMLSCFICPRPIHWKEAHLMHCEPRGCWSVRYDRINCQAGCPECNGKPNGDRTTFRIRLDQAFGPGTAERNTIRSKRMQKWGTTELLALIEELEQELKTLI